MRIDYRKLERILQETENWLLRDSDDVQANHIYSQETMEILGKSVTNDSYARLVRNVLRYIQNGNGKKK